MDGIDGEHDGPFLRARLRVDQRYRLELEQARAYGVPHSVFTGRVTEPGEPLFLQIDTDAAVALAEEEEATCPQCGMLKVWCRDPAHQFDTFEIAEEQCHATYAMAVHQSALADRRDDAQRASIRPWVKFKAGKQPDLTAGLHGLDAIEGD